MHLNLNRFGVIESVLYKTSLVIMENARKARVEFEGALYHVIVRGNQRQKIL